MANSINYVFKFILVRDSKVDKSQFLHLLATETINKNQR